MAQKGEVVVVKEEGDWRRQRCQKCGSHLRAGRIEHLLVSKGLSIGQNHYCRILYCPLCEPEGLFSEGEPLEINQIHLCYHPSSPIPEVITFCYLFEEIDKRLNKTFIPSIVHSSLSVDNQLVSP